MKSNFVQVLTPYTNTYGANNSSHAISNYRCRVDGCKRVELSYSKIIMHLAVEHGVRPVKIGEPITDGKSNSN